MLIDNITDLHVHGSPSLVPRHGDDTSTITANKNVGVTLSVLKAHEGSTAERALAVGEGAIGGIVLNSPVGGPNPDAVEVAAHFGARMVWMPTISAPAHRASLQSQELAVHRGIDLREVPVFDGTRLLPAWNEVLEVVAARDLVLASGHLTCDEAVALFRAASRAGVNRLLLTHPVLPFQKWDASLVPELRRMGVYLELSILPDLVVGDRGPRSADIAGVYPEELLAFGGDLGHADFPRLEQALPGWLHDLVDRVGEAAAERIMTTNGRTLVLADG